MFLASTLYLSLFTGQEQVMYFYLEHYGLRQYPQVSLTLHMTTIYKKH